MVEKHPFGNFVPTNAQHLLLGSFVARKVEGYDWFYSNNRNQFWPILEEVYGKSLQIKKDKQDLFMRLGMAIDDIILECERKANNNSDMSLVNIVFNIGAIGDILKTNKIKTIYFTSRFVEKLFKRHFKETIDKYSEVELVTLPSPSPRYATMSKPEKIIRYKELMPKLS